MPSSEGIPDLQALRQKLADTRREVRNLIVMGKRPNLTPEKAELIRNLPQARSKDRQRVSKNHGFQIDSAKEAVPKAQN